MVTADNYIFTTKHGCGRYALTDTKSMKKRFDLSNRLRESLKPNYNAAPTQQMPVILRRGSTNEVEIMKWGFTPVWAKDKPSFAYSTFNAKAETLDEKPLWKKAFATSRCLVPFNAFYEWKKEGSKKQPFLFQIGKQELSAFAGLYTEWVDDATGDSHGSYTIITTKPDATMEGVHDRMPVILDRDEEDLWLENGEVDLGMLETMLNPYGKKDLTKYEISPEVGNVRNNYEELLEKAA